jgi:hypothetical protein
MLIGVYGILYHPEVSAESDQPGLFEQMSGLVQWISIFSPVATAPAAFLLGVESISSK